MAYIKDGLKGQIRIFVQRHFWGHMVVLFYNNNGKTCYKKYQFYLHFFQNTLIFVVDKIPHSQDTEPYQDISKIWSIQLLLFDFVIM